MATTGEFISELPAVPSVQLTDVYPVVQSGVTYKESITQLVSFLTTGATLPYVPIGGGTMTGSLILSGDATLPLQAVTFEQLQLVVSGITVILACEAATTVNLNATQAGAGIGATLTNAGPQVPFAVDGYTAIVGNRILVKNQTLQQHNGIYVVTDIGSISTNWVLTRALDYDTPSEIKPGTLVAVNNGGQATTSWLETATVVIVDTDPVVFSQFTFSPTSFLLRANNLSDVASLPATLVNLGFGTPTGTYPGNVVMQMNPTMPGYISGLTDIRDLSNNIILQFVSQPSAVNYIGVLNRQSTSTPYIFADGADATVALGFASKGGDFSLFDATSTNGARLGFGSPGGGGTLLSVSASQTTTLFLTLPAVDGTAGQFLQTNGAGVLSFATAGSGSFVTSNISVASGGVAVPSVTGTNITSIIISAGTWEVYGNVYITCSANALNQFFAWTNNASATSPDGSFWSVHYPTVSFPNPQAGMVVPTRRYTVAVPTTIYLSVFVGVNSGTIRGYGNISARQV